MSPLAKRLRATVHNGIIAPGSSPHEYVIAESQVREAADRIEELEAKLERVRGLLEEWRELAYPWLMEGVDGPAYGKGLGSAYTACAADLTAALTEETP